MLMRRIVSAGEPSRAAIKSLGVQAWSQGHEVLYAEHHRCHSIPLVCLTFAPLTDSLYSPAPSQ